MSYNLIKDTSGTYHSIAQIRDLYIDNNSATDWYVAVRLVDNTTYAILDGFADQAGADEAAREVADAIGFLDVSTLL